MLFRTNTGELIELNKYQFLNDKFYYQKIMDVKKLVNKDKDKETPKFYMFDKSTASNKSSKTNQKKLLHTKIINKPIKTVNI